MATLSEGKRRQFLRRLFWLLAILILIGVISFLRGPQFRAILEALEAPTLPPSPDYSERVWLADGQNWDQAMRRKFHHISQGTRTLPIPIDWLMGLERPASSLFTIAFGDRGLFAQNDYLLRFGFIEGEKSEVNPLGLPVGFALSPNQNLPGISGEVTAVGFNCSACHTAHLRHDNIEYIVEGGPAATDLGQLTAALGAALGQTLASSKIPLFKARFNRFASNVLGEDANTQANKALLASELESLINHLATLPSGVDIVEGYTRLDALNRIGNQVFAIDPGRFDNYVAINAPVNYPHIWTASWFDWVQYDGSIMAPLVRNAGEAMGVSAGVNTTSPDGDRRFSSSINMDNLWWIENSLSGTNPDPASDGAGLLAPRWPESFGAIDTARAGRGAEIYNRICIDCHLPTLDSPQIWLPEHYGPVEYFVDGARRTTPEKLLKLHVIDLEQVGTDPAQANVLINRTVNTAGYDGGTAEQNYTGMGIDTQVCANAPLFPPSPYDEPNYSRKQSGPLVNVPISDGPFVNFGLALGGIVNEVIDAWFAQNYIAAADQLRYNEYRPNCLRADAGYKARPLNGVWATAPFLHNGSVPTVYDLLTPPDQRPEYVKLGDIEFDSVHLGLHRELDLQPRGDDLYDRDGYFILNTNTPGNHNTGHEFSDRWDDSKHWSEQEKGVIGPAFTHDEKLDIIEFLKTL